MASIKFFEAEEIAPKSWKIRDVFVDESDPYYCYLVQGKDYALLIDTMMGFGNLHEFCKTLTDKPIKLVNTHAHWDHIGGNFNFEEFYIHHREITLFQESLAYTKQQVVDAALRMARDEYKELFMPEYIEAPKPMKLFPVYDGDIFDLGDKQLEVVEVGGHSAGSIALIDKQTRIAYAGDVCNSNTLLELPTSLPVEAYLKSLLHLKEHQNEFDMMYGGHEILGKTILDEAVETVKKVLDGTDDRYEQIGMLGTPVLYAAKKAENGFERADGKRFNMSYLADRIRGNGHERQIIKL